MKSMTGYGSAEKISRGERLSIELKSLNNRYLEFKFRNPRDFSVFEKRLVDELKKTCRRGYIEVIISRDQVGTKRQARHEFNEELVREYLRSLKGAKRKLGIKGDITLDQVLRLPDIWVSVKRSHSVEQHWPVLKTLLRASMHQLVQMRTREGKALFGAVTKYLGHFERELNHLMKHKERLVREFQAKLKRRVASLMNHAQLDSKRLNQEVAHLVDRADVSEELDRLKSHLKQFRTAIKGQGTVGKHLDFMIQEMNREVNTIGSKIQDTRLTAHVIQCKSLLEKIREQIQNVE